MNDWSIHNDTIKDPVSADTRRDQRLKKACKAFESIFTYEVLKGMRRTVEKCDLFHGGQGEEIYEGLLDQELAKGMAGDGPGSLADQLYRQLKRSEGAENGEELKTEPGKSLVSNSKVFGKTHDEIPDKGKGRNVLEFSGNSR
jgi:flagellar protein FlgJ